MEQKVYIKLSNGDEHYLSPNELLPDKGKRISGSSIVRNTLMYRADQLRVGNKTLTIKRLEFPEGLNYNDNYLYCMQTPSPGDITEYKLIRVCDTGIELYIDFYFELEHDLYVPHGVRKLVLNPFSKIKGISHLPSDLTDLSIGTPFIEGEIDVSNLTYLRNLEYEDVVPKLKGIDKKFVFNPYGTFVDSVFVSFDKRLSGFESFFVKIGFMYVEPTSMVFKTQKPCVGIGYTNESDIPKTDISDILPVDLGRYEMDVYAATVRTKNVFNYRDDIDAFKGWLASIGKEPNKMWVDVKPSEPLNNGHDVLTTPGDVYGFSIRRVPVRKVIGDPKTPFININNCGTEELVLSEGNIHVYCENNNIEEVELPFSIFRFMCDNNVQIKNVDDIMEHNPNVIIEMIDPVNT